MLVLRGSEDPRDGDGRARGQPGARTIFDVKPRVAMRKPSMYKVFLLNDDYTPMDFVVGILEKIFNKNHEDAMRIMLQVHVQGLGLCGVYTHEVAETKVAQTLHAARAAEHPLQCTIERA